MDEGSLPVVKPSEISSVPSGWPALAGTAGKSRFSDGLAPPGMDHARRSVGQSVLVVQCGSPGAFSHAAVPQPAFLPTLRHQHLGRGAWVKAESPYSRPM